MKPFEDPHSSSIETVIETLATGTNGLSNREAKGRLITYGPNELPEGESISLVLLMTRQLKSWLVIILIIAAIISFLAGQVIDTWVIIIVVFVNAGIGFSQEYRAEKAISALRKLIVKTAKVLRDGELCSIPSAQLVPGDVIILEAGDSIPADGRIFQSKNLRTNEASLTGESLPNSKNEKPISTGTPLADRENMLWKSTFVSSGYARAIVTATGIHTAIGDISTTLGQIDESRTNFMKKTDILARQMSVVAIGSATLIFLVGYFIRQFDINEILLTSIAALVAAVPEGLPAVISIVLAIGANRMAKQNAIIREFTATETLGAVTAILTDKTGTLTRNTLTVRKVFVPGVEEFTVTGEGWFPVGNFVHHDTIMRVEEYPTLRKLLKIAAISNNAEIKLNPETKRHELIGDPTEGALSVLSRKGGLHPDRLQEFKRDDFPFNSEIKLRATLFEEENQSELLVTGAPEKLLERSGYLSGPNGETQLTSKEKKKIHDKIFEWSNQAMRVIALAYKKQDQARIDADNIDDLVFVGLVGMIDPPRLDTMEAVKKCKMAGIRVIMVTGDHVNTAAAIARASGIIEDEGPGEVQALTEQQLLELSDDEFDEAIRNISVFARLTPRMKLRIAGRLQAMGHLIAMTGDGVNDAPALKKADVGISMGIIGTDVARESSDVVLADDNFSTIVNAVEQGRIVFTNSRQTSFFLITTNIAESATLLIAIATGLPLPLTATQILWLNLVTDGVTDMALATEPGHGDIMKDEPSPKNEQILNKKVLPFLMINVVLISGLSFAAFFYYIDTGIEQARTGVFIAMAFCQLFNVFNLRSIKQSVFAIGFFSNKYINMGVGISIVLLILVTEIPALAFVFHFQSLPLIDFLVLFIMSSSVLLAGESYKFLVKNYRK